MKSEWTEREDGRRAIAIRAEWSEVVDDYDDLFSGYAGRALPGFRPGKAPRAVIEQRFREIIRDDIAARCGRRLAREALREADLRPAGPIALSEIRLEPRREFSFTAEFVPSPVFDLPDYAAARPGGETRDGRRDELAGWLLSRTPGDVPAALVRQECDRNGQAGAGPGSEAWEAAARRVKLAAILAQIAGIEGIQTDPRDVDARIGKVAAESGLDPGELRQKLEREDGLASLQSLLLAEQTLNYLLESAARAGARAGGPSNPRIAPGNGRTKPRRIRNGKPSQKRRQR